MRNFRNSRSRGFNGNGKKSYNNFRPRFGGQARFRNKGLLLNPLMFVKRADYTVEAPYVPVHSFSDFALNSQLAQNVQARGYTTPTPVQDQAIIPLLEGRDLVGVAETGTGKTAAFLLPLITKIAGDRNQKVLIVTPTRELAVQIQDEFRLFSQRMGIYSSLCIGGASLNMQSRELRRRPHFVIGTPGRLKDLEQRRILNLSHYKNVVLDEVDRMLDMGFINDVKHIISLLPKERQSMFFSATIPDQTRVVMQSFLVNPVSVSIKTGSTSQNIDQDIVRTQGKNKLELLHDLLIKKEFQKVLIFGRTKWGVSKLEASLTERGFKAVSIHGNKSQGQRLRALKMLKTNQVNILLATDVASRGIDIDDITHVINYDVPETYEDYIHRIGRTGRAGKKGTALTFVDR